MNIKQAKENIKNAVAAYLAKDKFGNLIIPVERQRPLFLIGAPGIGKTAVMEQVAEELKIGLVSYSMTHHTRQSALGLPFIVKKEYGGVEYSVSEYTMSEIIASVYDTIEETGFSEGILFLDEINCVSETLAPAMLQFLQYKTFGRHKVPSGWIVVTAGNPPEYNSSARDFDIVTLDRLKRIDVEASYDAWREYALSKGTHPAILTYLDIKKDDLFKIAATVDGRTFVTPRGWSDLSDMMRIYEQKEFPINESLIAQYLQDRDVAKSFAAYYDLFRKYRSDYRVDKILKGTADEEIIERARAAAFDERLSLLGLILDALVGSVRKAELFENELEELMKCLKIVKHDLCEEERFEDSVKRQINEKQRELANGHKASNISRDRILVLNAAMAALEEERGILTENRPADASAAFKLLKEDFDRRKKELAKPVTAASDSLSNAFKFCEAAFEKGSQELLILVTELTVSSYTARFIGRYGCKEYLDNNKDMMFYERQKKLKREIEELFPGNED